MRLIKITFQDGTVKEWRHEGRAGGSYTKSLEKKDGYVTVRDEYDNTFSYPNEWVKEIEVRP